MRIFFFFILMFLRSSRWLRFQSLQITVHNTFKALWSFQSRLPLKQPHQRFFQDPFRRDTSQNPLFCPTTLRKALGMPASHFFSAKPSSCFIFFPSSSHLQEIPVHSNQRGARPVQSGVQRPVRRVQGAPRRGAVHAEEVRRDGRHDAQSAPAPDQPDGERLHALPVPFKIIPLSSLTNTPHCVSSWFSDSPLQKAESLHISQVNLGC